VDYPVIPGHGWTRPSRTALFPFVKTAWHLPFWRVPAYSNNIVIGFLKPPRDHCTPPHNKRGIYQLTCNTYNLWARLAVAWTYVSKNKYDTLDTIVPNNKGRWHQVGLTLFNYQDDARSNKHRIHQIYIYHLIHNHFIVKGDRYMWIKLEVYKRKQVSIIEDDVINFILKYRVFENSLCKYMPQYSRLIYTKTTAGAHSMLAFFRQQSVPALVLRDHTPPSLLGLTLLNNHRGINIDTVTFWTPCIKTHSKNVGMVINPSAWGHLNPSSYYDVGRLFYGVFKLWSKLQRKKWRNNF